MSKARLERLEKATKAGKYPTSMGDREWDTGSKRRNVPPDPTPKTSSGGVFHAPNKFKKVTEPASSIKNRRREQRESE